MPPLFLALLTLTATAQINYPYNPDENADAFISTPDLMEFLVVFGYEWEQEEIQVDSIPLSMYLSSLEAMIEASGLRAPCQSALPEGTNPGQFHQWWLGGLGTGHAQSGCTLPLKALPEACNYVLVEPTYFCGGRRVHPSRRVRRVRRSWCHLRCADISEGEVVIATAGQRGGRLGACGGTCAADEDGDGICDDGDCVGKRRTNAVCATVRG